MSALLEQAFEKARQLPAHEQEQFAAFLLAELEAEERWRTLFTESADFLDQLADDITAEHRAGKTTELDTDDL